MSLPLKAVDRLFERLSATYGRQFTDLYGNVDPDAVKTAWAHELSTFANSLHRVAWALENLPPRCPNAVEFKALCRSAPAPQAPRLQEPRSNPERVRQELAKLEDRHGPAVQYRDNRAWAKRIIARHEGGEKLSPTTLGLAREALGLSKPQSSFA